MATKVIMPKQGLQMTEGIITKWLAQEGDQVKQNMPLFEMETDKLTIAIDSPATGTLLQIIKAVGETVPITETIAVIGDPGEDISALLAETGRLVQPHEASINETAKGQQAESTADERLFATPRAKMTATQKSINLADITGTGPDGLIIEKNVIAYAAGMVKSKATPLARKAAQQKDINLADISGSGARGKITRSDVEAVASARFGKTAAAARQGHLVPMTGIRRVIADRMMQSLQGMAQANHRMKVDMSETIRLREKLKEAGIKVSFTDILVKAVSRALLDFPMINASLTDEGILVKDYVNMGLAVAVENGLIVPVIKDADQMTLQEISAASAELIQKAQKSSLQPDEYTGGTFTITNLGMFDIDEFTAIINPPEAAILAIGKIDRVPVAIGDDLVIRPVMVMSLTYDHRIIDGAPAARFMQKIKEILQNPYMLI